MAIEIMGLGIPHAGVGILGIGIGFILSKVMTGKKEQSVGFMPADLDKWMVETKYKDILSNKNSVGFAKSELETLEQEEADNKRKKAKIEKELNQYLDKADQIQNELESARSNLTQRSKSDILFSTVMKDIANLSYETQGINNDSLPYARTKRFLQLVSQSKSQSAIQRAMNGDNIDIFEKNPYNKNVDIINSQWEAFDKIPGLQSKIIDEMLAPPKQN
jgi:hypothetical protein